MDRPIGEGGEGNRASERGRPPVALVTGANRGIGFEVCRQLAHRGYAVVLGSRDAAKGERAAADLARGGGTVRACQLDLTDAKSIERARTHVAAEFARLDVLVNNAAILYDAWQRAVDADLAQVREALETNLFGAWSMVRALPDDGPTGGFFRDGRPLPW